MEAAEVDQVAVAQLEAAELDRQGALVVVADLVVPVGVDPAEDVHQLVQVVQAVVLVVQAVVLVVQAVVLVVQAVVLVVQAVVLVDQVAAVERFVVVVHVFLAQEDLPIREVGPESIVNKC